MPVYRLHGCKDIGDGRDLLSDVQKHERLRQCIYPTPGSNQCVLLLHVTQDEQLSSQARFWCFGCLIAFSQLDRLAVKVMKSEGATEIARFEREARVLRDLDDPRVVRYVAQGTTPSGDPYLVMEWLEGFADSTGSKTPLCNGRSKTRAAALESDAHLSRLLQ